MKVAIIGSRSITQYPLENILPPDATEIVSGGARGVDLLARQYAAQHRLPCTEFLPDYDRFGRSAPLRRNDQIIAHADLVIAIWDGSSRGTAYVISRCRQTGREVRVIRT